VEAILLAPAFSVEGQRIGFLPVESEVKVNSHCVNNRICEFTEMSSRSLSFKVGKIM